MPAAAADHLATAPAGLSSETVARYMVEMVLKRFVQRLDDFSIAHSTGPLTHDRNQDRSAFLKNSVNGAKAITNNMAERLEITAPANKSIVQTVPNMIPIIINGIFIKSI